MRIDALRGERAWLGLAVAAVIACGSDEHVPAATAGDGASGESSASSGEDDAGPDSSGSSDDDGSEGGVLLTPPERLVRIAMALRGLRPSEDELAAVTDDPSVLPEIVDAYLETPEFGATIRDLHNDALLVLTDFFIYPAGFPRLPPLESADPYQLNRSITEAPLRLVEHVILNDRPYSEIVTAEYTVANGLVAAVWGLPYAGNGDAWEESRWPDGRDPAGILADSWLWQRHSSTPSNGNRGRANALARALLCFDFLASDIQIDASVDLADPDVVAEAVRNDPACASCHETLDPLAGFFGDYMGLFVPAELPEYGYPTYPFGTYAPGFFASEYGITLREPAYFGTPGEGMTELGGFIADDPRFARCAVERFYAYFHQIERSEIPSDHATALLEVFTDSGLDAKALTRAIVLSDAFAVSHAEDANDDQVRGLKRARPFQLARLVESLTGVRWRTQLSVPAEGLETGVLDLMDDAFFGYQVLAGGIDAMYVNKPSYTYSATSSLVLRGLATEAGGRVVDHDFDEADRSARFLLDRVDETDTDEALIREQLVALHLRLYGQPLDADAPEIDDGWQLFSEAFAHGARTRRAWQVTLTAMLQDLRIAYY